MENKPQILVSIKSLDELNLAADGYVLGYEKFTSFGAHNYSYDELTKIKDKNKVYLLLNALIHQDQLDELKVELNKLVKLGINFIVQDIGIIHYLNSINYQGTVIFNPYTLITNSDELEAYRTSNIIASLSNYLNPLEYNSIKQYSNSLITVFGYVPLYQTYRQILSLYKEKYQVIVEDNRLFIKENERNELMPIIENDYGTVIFKSEPIDLTNELHYFNNVRYIFIDQNMIDDNLFKSKLEIVRKYFKNEED